MGRLTGMVACWVAGFILLAGAHITIAQEDDSRLMIDRVSHETVNGQPVIVVTIANDTGGRIGYTGTVTVSHQSGEEVATHDLAPGSVPAQTSIRVPVYLGSGLMDGAYRAGIEVRSGTGELMDQRSDFEFRIGEEPSSTPPYPAIAMLIAGLLLILASVRVGYVRRKRNVPDVAAVRKVSVNSVPARRTGKITPLIPPRFRQDD